MHQLHSAQQVEGRLGFSSTCAEYAVFAKFQRLRAAAHVGFTAAYIVPVSWYMTECPLACMYIGLWFGVRLTQVYIVHAAARGLHGTRGSQCVGLV